MLNLLGERLTNREVAERLLSKTGRRSRVELAELLHATRDLQSGGQRESE